MKNKKRSQLTLTYYIKGKNNNWYCDYVYSNSNEYKTGTTRATGWGYDKQSTCVSNAINLFKDKYIRYTEYAKKYTSYGLYEDNTISYGIGISAVLHCVKCFKNVKIIRAYYGKFENRITLYIYE